MILSASESLSIRKKGYFKYTKNIFSKYQQHQHSKYANLGTYTIFEFQKIHADIDINNSF